MYYLRLMVDVESGGAQAIAAMAYGTETVPKVDKLCGPGNSFVTMAKMLVQNDSSASVSIDMPAGPSEVMVCIYITILTSSGVLLDNFCPRCLMIFCDYFRRNNCIHSHNTKQKK